MMSGEVSEQEQLDLDQIGMLDAEELELEESFDEETFMSFLGELIDSLDNNDDLSFTLDGEECRVTAENLLIAEYWITFVENITEKELALKIKWK